MFAKENAPFSIDLMLDGRFKVPLIVDFSKAKPSITSRLFESLSSPIFVQRKLCLLIILTVSGRVIFLKSVRASVTFGPIEEIGRASCRERVYIKERAECL